MGSFFSKASNLVSENSPMGKLISKTNDYTIYTFFIQKKLKLHELIKSPLRNDKNPTFNIYRPQTPRWEDQLLFKDYNGESGNVFKFVKLFAFHNYSIRLESIQDIIYFIENKLNLNSEDPIRIDFKEIEDDGKFNMNYGVKHFEKWQDYHLEFWNNIGVSEKLLNYYRVRPVKYLLNNEGRKIKNFEYTNTFVYWISDKFKIYQPYEENFKKFFNQCPKKIQYVQGIDYCFGRKKEILITKSMKDILVFQAHTKEWENIIAPHGEGYNIEEMLIYWILQNFKKITIIYDFDYTGVKASNKLRKQLKSSRFYQDNIIRVRFISTHRVLKRGKMIVPDKDISDYRIVNGEEKTKKLINYLLNG